MARVRNIHINEVNCKGCGICAAVCPRDAIEMSPDLSERGVHPPRIRDLSLCTGCRLCELHCPDFAIAIELGSENVDSKAG
ncbi:MAG: 4Fe-4S binding protein [Bacillota bacterium]